MISPTAIVIGAGSTGAAIAHDLSLRGFRVTLVERFGIASGTTGHNQAQLHSGARYAVNDPTSARECIEDNLILRQLMPEALELNDGLFIGLNEEHLAYQIISRGLRTLRHTCPGVNRPSGTGTGTPSQPLPAGSHPGPGWCF